MMAARNIMRTNLTGSERITKPISCITPIAIRVTRTTVSESILSLHKSIFFPPIKNLIKRANDKEPIKMADNLKTKPLNSTPSPNEGRVDVKSQTDSGAINVVGIDRPVTIAGSILTSNANAAAELRGGAAEAKVNPVTNQPDNPANRQAMKVMQGKMIRTNAIVVTTNSGRFKTENNLMGSILNIELIAINTEISTT